MYSASSIKRVLLPLLLVVFVAGQATAFHPNHSTGPEPHSVNPALPDTSPSPQNETSEAPTNWETTFPMVQSGSIFGMDSTRNGTMYVVGKGVPTNESGATQAFAARLDSRGEIEWFRFFERPGYAWFRDVLLVPGEGLLVVGAHSSQMAYGGGDGWVARLSPSNGSIVWERNDTRGTETAWNTILPGPNSTVILGGLYGFAVGEGQFARVRIHDGSTVWHRRQVNTSVEDGTMSSDGRTAVFATGQEGIGLNATTGAHEWKFDQTDFGDRYLWLSEVIRTQDGYLFGGSFSQATENDTHAFLAETSIEGNVGTVTQPWSDTRVWSSFSIASIPGEPRRVLVSLDAYRGPWVTLFVDSRASAFVYPGFSVYDIEILGPRTHVLAGPGPSVLRTDASPPDAVLDATPTTGTESNTTFTFDASQSLDAAEYRWNLTNEPGFENTSTTPRLEYEFENPGQKVVHVSVVDRDGNVDNDSTAVMVRDVTPPRVSIAPSQTRFISTVGPTVLDVSNSTDNNEIVAYHWDIDDDGAFEARTESPKYRYWFRERGTHSVRVMVVDGWNNTATDTFTFETRPNDVPTGSISPNRTFGRYAHLSVSANDTVGGIKNVTWILPNGSTVSKRSLDYRFEETGNRTVEVVLTDRYGATRRIQVQVQVDSPPTHLRSGDVILLFVFLAFSLGAKLAGLVGIVVGLYILLKRYLW